MIKYSRWLSLCAFFLYCACYCSGDASINHDGLTMCCDTVEVDDQVLADGNDDFDIEQALRSLNLDELAEKPPRDLTFSEFVAFYYEAIRNGVAWSVAKRHVKDHAYWYVSGTVAVVVLGGLLLLYYQSHTETPS